MPWYIEDDGNDSKSRYDYYPDMIKVLKDKGLYIIKESPYTWYGNGEDSDAYVLGSDFYLCTVAGTMKQINRLFDETSPIDGYGFILISALHPDFVDLVREKYDGDLADMKSEDLEYERVFDKNEILVTVTVE
jgi:hypothetical protein